jgi:hypothetical protein
MFRGSLAETDTAMSSNWVSNSDRLGPAYADNLENVHQACLSAVQTDLKSSAVQSGCSASRTPCKNLPRIMTVPCGCCRTFPLPVERLANNSVKLSTVLARVVAGILIQTCNSTEYIVVWRLFRASFPNTNLGAIYEHGQSPVELSSSFALSRE